MEGKLPIKNDGGEIVNYQYCAADADILGITEYEYSQVFPLTYQDKVFTGKVKKSYQLGLFQKLIKLPFGKNSFTHCDKVTSELPLKIGESFYLPIVFYTEESKEYVLQNKTYTKQEAETLARNKLAEFCEKLEQKGVQILKNNVIIVTEDKRCTAKGTITVMEPIGSRQATGRAELPQEGQETNESDGNNN